MDRFAIPRYGRLPRENGAQGIMLGRLDHAHAMRIDWKAEEWDMKLGYNVDARKRAVNLTLNEDLLAHVREITENLSSVVESLLAEYLAKERQRRAAQVKIVESTVALWNQFGDENGSFADDHSTL
jgi:antitoxin CcdA